MLKQNMLYGSSRLGLWERNKKLTFTPVTETIQSVYRGDKRYELSDHLGNVHVVLTDRKELHCGLEDNVPFPEYYTAEVKNRYDYYPFGMLMEERKYSAPGCIYDTDTLFTLVFADYFSAPVADWYYLDGFFNPTVSGGYMHLDQPDNTLFKLITPTAIGKQYRVRFGVDMNGCDSARVAGNVQGLTMQTFTSSGDHVFYFSSNDSMYSGVSFYVDAPCDVLIDYVIVEEMDISSTVVCDSNAALAYRYGFNSKWKDDEVYGIEGTAYDFGARLYDSRLGRFMSTDPVSYQYVWQSSYVFANNNPIALLDIQGMNGEPINEEPKRNICIMILTHNEIIMFGLDKVNNTVHGDWQIFVSTDIEKSQAEVFNYLGEQPIDNLYYVSHGAFGRNEDGGADQGSGRLITQEVVLDEWNCQVQPRIAIGLDEMNFYRYPNNDLINQDPKLKEIMNDVGALDKLLDRISTGGTAIFLGCKLGMSDTDLGVAFLPEKSGVTLFFNNDYSSNVVKDKNFVGGLFDNPLTREGNLINGWESIKTGIDSDTGDPKPTGSSSLKNNEGKPGVIQVNSNIKNGTTKIN